MINQSPLHTLQAAYSSMPSSSYHTVFHNHSIDIRHAAGPVRLRGTGTLFLCGNSSYVVGCLLFKTSCLQWSGNPSWSDPGVDPGTGCDDLGCPVGDLAGPHRPPRCGLTWRAPSGRMPESTIRRTMASVRNAVGVAGLTMVGRPARNAGASFSRAPQHGKLKALT